MTRKGWNKRLVLAAVAAVLIITGSAWFVKSRGGWVNALHLPPVRDSSTPAAQNGFTLAAITLAELDKNKTPEYTYQDIDEDEYVGPGFCGLWIRTPPIPREVYPGDSITSLESDSFGPSGKWFSVTARTPSGDTLPLPWKMTQAPPHYDDHYDEAAGSSVPGTTYLLAALPASYPNPCRYIDVTVSDTKGHTAHWRITRLPRMKQILPQPIIVQDKVTAHGITVTADAWRDGIGYVEYRLRPVLPPNSHQWDFNYTGSWLEYEPFDYQTGPTEISHSHPIQARNGVFTGIPEKYEQGIIGGIAEAPYHSSSRFIRFTCELRQFETYDETVTFHNVDMAREPNWPKGRPNSEAAYYLNVTRPQTVTTPSGIQVTLPAQGKPAQMLGGGINIVFQVQPSQPLDALPRLPLVKTYGKPFSLDYVFPPPFEVNSWQFDTGPLHHYQVQYKYPPPAVYPTQLKDFSIIIRQRVELQKIPMTFTVPVTDPKPSPYQKPKTL